MSIRAYNAMNKNNFTEEASRPWLPISAEVLKPWEVYSACWREACQYHP